MLHFLRQATLSFVFVLLFLLLNNTYLHAQVNVVTQHNNLKRTGWNANENLLTQASISGGNFGLVFSRAVDDQIYAQPLVLSNVSIGGGTHNIVIVATVGNSVYAFDADNANTTTPYWQKNLTLTNYRVVNKTDLVHDGYYGICGSTCSGSNGTGCNANNYNDFSGNIGIVSTPVIDTITNTIYIVSRSVSQNGQTFVQYLHALNIATGAEKANSPVAITGSVPGTGYGTDGTNVAFNPQIENQRPGLLLYNGVVYIAWASHCDWGPYHGWIMGYDATSLQQKYIYNTTPNGQLGGIWMSGQAPAVDDNGFLYVSTGNGTTGTSGNVNNATERGESLIKLSQGLVVQDFFTPMDYQALNDGDLDYGSDGVMLIPNTNFSLSGSKESYLYMIDNTNMGKTTSDNSNVKELLNVNASSTNYDKHLHGSPVYFKDENAQEYVYAWAETGLLKQFPFNRASLVFDTLNKKVGNTVLPYGMPGAMLALSSNNSAQGTGILWAVHPINGDANQAVVPGIVQAFDATDITHELWNSNMNGIRDAVGNLAKFVAPTIANGKVYISTFSNKLNVYGLGPAVSACQSSLPSPWQSGDIGYVAKSGDACYSNGVYTITASGTNITGTADAFHHLYQSTTGTNISIIARILSIQNNNASAQAGVMFRSNMDAGSPNVFLGLTAGNKAVFQNRVQQSGTTTSLDKGSFSTAYWVKLTNTGNKYVGYLSPDGITWTAVDSVTVALGSSPLVSFAYSSADNTVLGTATVDNLSVGSGAPLPINLSNFTVKNIANSYAQLNWITSTESNNDYFEIERSSGSTDFAAIGSVKGAGTTTLQQQYAFNDANPLEGINYYRLKQVDINGNYTYSAVVAVNFNLSLIDIYPNPATNLVYITNNSRFSNGENLDIQLSNMLGQVLVRQSAPTNGVNTIQVNIPASVTKGVYVLMVTNSKGLKQARKIFITR